VIAEVAQFHPIDSPVNDDLCFSIAELQPPFHENVSLVPRQVMANLIRRVIFVYKRHNVKQRTCVSKNKMRFRP
jgi:hypothetical protein